MICTGYRLNIAQFTTRRMFWGFLPPTKYCHVIGRVVKGRGGSAKRPSNIQSGTTPAKTPENPIAKCLDQPRPVLLTWYFLISLCALFSV